MKRIAALILLSAILLPVIACAEDMVLTASVRRVLTKITKSGDPMVIVFIQEQRTLNGVSYTADAPVFASGAVKSEAEQLKDGDTLKAIVSKRQANGDITYTLHKVIK